MVNNKSIKKYTYSVGRRKSSSCRVRLFKGSGQNEVNGMPIGKYFPGKVMAYKWEMPFSLTDTKGKYYVTVKVIGGGKEGQLDAVTHAIAKAFSLLDPDKYRAPLKAEGLLTRDARIRERRKAGTGGRARKQKQSPKR